MNINQLLHKHNCNCGKTHVCEIKHVFIERNVHLRLNELCVNHDSIMLVADENTFATCGNKVLHVLKEKKITQVIFSGKKILIPNESAVDSVTNSLTNCTLIIGIGSGVIQDLCKYIAHNKHLSYYIIATAPSMDGYASSGAAMIMNNSKITFPAKVPDAILADPEILANAPIDMIKSGYGDIVGKYSALNDWKLSNIVFGEYYCQYCYDLTYEMIKKTLELSDGLLNHDSDSIKALMEALVVVGIAMSFVGNSRPASGSEHHLSHYFEITGIEHGEAYLPHGIDVVYSTVLTQQLREKILALPDWNVEQFKISPRKYRDTMAMIYGRSAEHCISLQNKLHRYEENRVTIYREKETEIRKVLSDAPSSKTILSLLRQVEMDMNDFYAFYSKNKINNGISWAKDLKDRYSILWMYFDLFGIIDI